MTQLDLPQISMRRYFDLLKRRRWQVIPISLLGLLVGGLVAFFIPRYYVADSTLVYETPPGEEVANATEDPLFAIVDSAIATVSNAIEPTVKLLGWEEASIADLYERTQRLKELDARLDVFDINASKGRKYAKILVVFRDRDGLRAATFVNTLVDTWIAQRLKELRSGVEKRKADATQRYNEHVSAFDQYLLRRKYLERTYQIEPNFNIDVQRAEYKTRKDAQLRRETELAALQAEIVGLQEQQKQLMDRRATLPLRVPAEVRTNDPALLKEPTVLKLMTEIRYYEKALENIQDGNPDRVRNQKMIAKLKADLAEEITRVAGAGVADPDGMIENPELALLLQELDRVDLALRTKQALFGPLQKEVAQQGQDLARLSDGYAEYSSLLRQIGETEGSLASTHADVDAANAMLGKLNNDAPVKVQIQAAPPPRPTEPNILLVALIGCVLGLGAAIGLILLLDLLQGSFKTVDDVERGLPVPVLGGVSHLETDVERLQASRGRRRITLVTAAFVVLISAVVLLFYWDPTRLPPFVRDLLALVLGRA